mmetsp:Transcript_2091/g.4467  ORF Transcript_2091/g.4467 Transcript_2091/m.4467 type:complete len:247 (+) Transcript_2091:318-1058(+)
MAGELARGLGQEFDETGEYEAARSSRSPYLLPELVDPPLTALGIEDAKRLRSIAPQLPNPALLVVSPLRRATQTILIGFGDLLAQNRQVPTTADTPAAMGRARAQIPVVAHEDCREQIGVHMCDRRFPKEDLEAEFGSSVDYSLIRDAPRDAPGAKGGGGGGGDPRWQADRRETYPEMAERAWFFLEWLRSRPEGEIVVGTHSAFLMCLFNVVLQVGNGDDDDGDKEGLATFFKTGELRSTVLTWE